MFLFVFVKHSLSGQTEKASQSSKKLKTSLTVQKLEICQRALKDEGKVVSEKQVSFMTILLNSNHS